MKGMDHSKKDGVKLFQFKESISATLNHAVQN